MPGRQIAHTYTNTAALANRFRPESGKRKTSHRVTARWDENKQNASNAHAGTRRIRLRICTHTQKEMEGVDKMGKMSTLRCSPVSSCFLLVSAHFPLAASKRCTGYIPSSLAVSSVHSISPLPCDLFNYFSPSLPLRRSLCGVVTAGCPCIGCVLDGWMDWWNGRLCWKP